VVKLVVKLGVFEEVSCLALARKEIVDDFVAFSLLLLCPAVSELH